MSDNSTTVLPLLSAIREASGQPETIGLPDEVISDFASRDDTLLQAVEEASINHQNLMAEFGKEVMMQSEVVG